MSKNIAKGTTDPCSIEILTGITPKFCIGFKIRKNNAGSGFGYSKGVKFCMHLDQLFFGSASAFPYFEADAELGVIYKLYKLLINIYVSICSYTKQTQNSNFDTITKIYLTSYIQNLKAHPLMGVLILDK